MTPPAGTSVTLRVGRSGMTPEQLQQNVAAALAGAAERIPRKWANIQAVYLKAAESVALPLWQTLPDPDTAAE
jgi:ribosome biogenesis protein UTP30